jgi:cell filamentation protein, protein adenylyltransferase
MADRQYLTSHPWITFTFDFSRLRPGTWMKLGEAASKMDHLAGVPLTPDIGQTLHTLYLSRGIQGTTAIEGNTLSEEQVRQAVQGQLRLPPSQDYLRQEVANVLGACHEIFARLAGSGPEPINPEWICRINQLVLEKLEVNEDVVPGKTRVHSVGVQMYRGAPAEDCDYLVERLCEWLNDPDWSKYKEYRKATAIIRAILAHLYIAWIHPFGDGNGRTARLLEFQLLVEGGAPSPAAHLLSNHFNLTRDAYYRELDKTSRSGPPYPVEGFVDYALQGLVDGLREQLKLVRENQTAITWVNYVHQKLPNNTASEARRRDLLLDLSPIDWTRRSDIPDASVRLARAYAGKTAKTLTRDLNVLSDLGLISRRSGQVRPRVEVLKSFLPVRLGNDDEE